MSCILLTTTPSNERSSRRLIGVTGALYILAGNLLSKSAFFGNRCTPSRRINHWTLIVSDRKLIINFCDQCIPLWRSHWTLPTSVMSVELVQDWPRAKMAAIAGPGGRDWWLGSAVVRASDLWSEDREFDSRPVHWRVTISQLSFPSLRVR